jgi:hypothetical protein
VPQRRGAGGVDGSPPFDPLPSMGRTSFVVCASAHRAGLKASLLGRRVSKGRKAS